MLVGARFVVEPVSTRAASSISTAMASLPDLDDDGFSAPKRPTEDPARIAAQKSATLRLTGPHDTDSAAEQHTHGERVDALHENVALHAPRCSWNTLTHATRSSARERRTHSIVSKTHSARAWVGFGMF